MRGHGMAIVQGKTQQPSYRDNEKHSCTLCSTLTHGKRKLNTLYKGIVNQSKTDQLILCRSCAVLMQGILIQKKTSACSKPPSSTFSNIHKKILNPKLDLKMWMSNWLVHGFAPHSPWAQRCSLLFLSRFVGTFKERSQIAKFFVLIFRKQTRLHFPCMRKMYKIFCEQIMCVNIHLFICLVEKYKYLYN